MCGRMLTTDISNKYTESGDSCLCVSFIFSKPKRTRKFLSIVENIYILKELERSTGKFVADQYGFNEKQ